MMAWRLHSFGCLRESREYDGWWCSNEFD